jgi:hypothetical protein
MTEENPGAPNALWGAIVVLATVLGFLSGYALSARTGVEPGYFLAAETGGYGAPPKEAGAAGMSEQMRKHYEELLK